MAPDSDRERYVRWAGGAGALATAIWLWLQLDFLDHRVFSNFYDIQARALLDGDLAVPTGSLGNEAFVARGHEFLYNPPGPSLLRVPVFLVTDRFDGRLTTLSMLAAWMVTIVVLALLVWRVRRLLRPTAVFTNREGALVAGFLLVAMVGSTLLYLGAIPWVFHEAYAWAIAMAVGSAYGLIGVVEHPTTGRILTTGLFTLGAVLSRTPAGLACAAAVIATAGWMWWRGRPARAPATPWVAIGLAGLLPALVGMAVNWAKFRHPYLFPIEDQVFTALSVHRREAIAANGGDLFDPSLIWSTAPAYFRPDGVRFSTLFPFISLPAEPAPAYRGAVFDLTYRTGSIVSFMPGLVGLALWGVVTAFRRRAPDAAVALRLPLLGLALIPVGVLFGAYMSHRYTAEFVPVLLVAGAVGLLDLARRLDRLHRSNRQAALAGLGAVALFGVLANVAVAVQAQALANPGPVLADHVGRQERYSSLLGGDLDEYVVASVALPGDAPADELRIIGECQAMYAATGEEFTPWTEVAVRPLELEFEVSESVTDTGTAPVPLAEFVGHRHSTLALESDGSGRFRVAVTGGGRDAASEWFDGSLATSFTVAVRTSGTADYVIEVDGEDVLRVPREEHDDEWYWQPNVLEPTAGSLPAATAGLTLTIEPTDTPDGCVELLDRYRERTPPTPTPTTAP